MQSYVQLHSQSHLAFYLLQLCTLRIGFPILSPSIVSSLLTFCINGSIHSMKSEHDRASPCFTDCSMSILSVLNPFTKTLLVKVSPQQQQSFSLQWGSEYKTSPKLKWLRYVSGPKFGKPLGNNTFLAYERCLANKIKAI